MANDYASHRSSQKGSRVNIKDTELRKRTSYLNDDGDDGGSSRKDDNQSQSGVSQIASLLDAMDDETLMKTTEEMQKSTRHMNLENQIFLNFLQKNDLTALEGMASTLKTAQTVHDRASVSSRRVTFTRSSRRESTMFGPVASNLIFTLDQAEKQETRSAPRVNMMQKMDLIAKEMEEMTASLGAATKKSQVVKGKLRSELEEMSIRETELNQIVELFETVFVTGTSEKFTQKNLTEKFIRFMEENLKNIRLTVDKIRLRTSSLKVQYQKICGILTHKKRIGENLQEVDFEQLHIENKHLSIKIDSRNLLLLELKKMNGHANLLLSNHKKLLARKVAEMNRIKEAISSKEEKVVKLDAECEKVSEGLDKTKDELDRLELKIRTYKAPDIIEYVKRKAELSVLKKNLKVWVRKKQIKDMALAACVREMKQVTGQPVAHASWFELSEQDTRHLSDFSFHFNFERAHQPKSKGLRSRRLKHL